MMQSYPTVNCSLQEFVEKQFGFKVTKVKKLVGFQNLNYQISTEEKDYVLKTYQQLKIEDSLRYQTNLLLYLNAKSPHKYSNPVKFKDGQTVKIYNFDGTLTIFRMLQYLKGQVFQFSEQTPQMVRSLGIFIGKLTKQLQGWTHPTTYEFAWKMENYHLLKEKTHLLKNEEVRKMVQEFLQSYEKAVVPHYPKLRKRTIHNDVNQMNIIVNKGQVTGLIDFADVQYSHLINELGIALFYMMYDKEDILYYSLMLLQQYHKIIPLTELQIHVLYHTIGLRAIMSILNTIETRQKDPQNDYLNYKAGYDQKFLKLLRTYDPEFMQKKFRTVCGLQTE